MRGEQFNQQCAEKGSEQHEGKSDAEHIPEAPGIGTGNAEESLGPSFGDGDFDGAREGNIAG